MLLMLQTVKHIHKIFMAFLMFSMVGTIRTIKGFIQGFYLLFKWRLAIYRKIWNFSYKIEWNNFILVVFDMLYSTAMVF